MLSVQSIQLLGLVCLIFAIAIGAKFKVNTGILGIAFAFIFGVYILQAKPSEVYAGFPSTTIFRLVGMTFFFGIVKSTNALNVLSKKLSNLTKGKSRFIPPVLFLIALALSGIGPGAIVTCAMLFPIAMEIAEDNRIPDMVMFTSIITGSLAGGLAPITATGIVASSFSEQVGIESYAPIFVSGLIVFGLQAVAGFFLFGGYKIENTVHEFKADELTFTKTQKFTLLVCAVCVLGIVIPKSVVPFFGWDIALAPFVFGSILLLCHVANEKDVISGIPWATILLISGVSMLVHVIDVSGGIEALSAFLSSFMNAKTASAIMAMLAGLMSCVSSGTGVVMPTLIPTAPGIVAQLGSSVSVSSLASAVIIGCSVVTVSPLSTLGALGFANATDREDKGRLFNKMLLFGLSSILFGGLLGLIGVYR